jgi:hypothetical protein
MLSSRIPLAALRVGRLVVQNDKSFTRRSS